MSTLLQMDEKIIKAISREIAMECEERSENYCYLTLLKSDADKVSSYPLHAISVVDISPLTDFQNESQND